MTERARATSAGAGRRAMAAAGGPGNPAPGAAGSSPARSGLVLVALILVAAVANLNLSVANIALPDIARTFDSSQTRLDLIAVGYSLGLAASVLYLGALGDRHGRKLMLILGTTLAVPASLLAAFAPSDLVLFAARVFGGLAAGMAYPTTLALITALWSGPPRTRAIALWSAVGGAMAAVGPLCAGILLQHYWWGSAFLFTIPLAVVALPLAFWLVPSHVNETSDKVDHAGGALSILWVGALVLGINLVSAPNQQVIALVLLGFAVLGIVAFAVRQRRAKNPLYDLHVAARRVFWVAACAGIIVFGALMGAIFLGQQFVQNVLGWSTLEAGLAAIPAAIFLVLIAPQSAKLVEKYGSRFTLLLGYLFCLLAFVTMLLLWGEGSPAWQVLIGYCFLGIGVSLAGTPASHSLTGSVPVRRAGMASATADLQRDLGGAILQSVFGALLTAGYAATMAASIASTGKASQVSDATQTQLTQSYAGAETIAKAYPQYAKQITEAARQAFLRGDRWAYAAGALAVLAGATIVFFLFPKKDPERELLASYHEQDQGGGSDGAGGQGEAPVQTAPATT
jgi:MFS transporter, DHA2 family, multidrug resistance protein